MHNWCTFYAGQTVQIGRTWTSPQRLLSLSDYKIYITQMPSRLVPTCANYNTGIGDKCIMITTYRNVTMLSDNVCER